jgi:pimeloyl-ACP methyl ester carboxylesterase
MSDLAESGFDVWALDFAGFGNSSRYPEMDAPATANPPLGRAEECSRQVSLAVRYIRNRQGVKRVSVIGDSGGSLVAGLYATREPEVLDRLVLFGPIAPIESKASTSDRTATTTAYFLITPDELVQQFASVPAGEKPVFDRKYFEDVWSPLLLDSDPTSRERKPPSVKVPNGRLADLAEIAAGHFPYDPAKIQAPTLVILGEWDTVTPEAPAHNLFNSLKSARLKRFVVIGRATHTIQFEESRFQLYQEVRTFLAADDSSPSQGTVSSSNK